MKKRLLITSIVMMLVVAVALSTATYAWFTSNANVSASTMTLKAAVSDSTALGIGWAGGEAGTEIIANISGELAPMAPVNLTVGTTTARPSGAAGANDIAFATQTTKNVDSVYVFNGEGGAATPLTYQNATAKAFYVKNLSNANVVGSITVRAIFGNDADTVIDGKAYTYSPIMTDEIAAGATYYTRTGEEPNYVYTAHTVGDEAIDNDNFTAASGNALANTKYYTKTGSTFALANPAPEVGTSVSSGYYTMEDINFSVAEADVKDGDDMIRVAIFRKNKTGSGNTLSYTSGDYTLLGILGQTATVYTAVTEGEFDKNKTYYTRSGDVYTQATTITASNFVTDGTLYTAQNTAVFGSITENGAVKDLSNHEVVTSIELIDDGSLGTLQSVELMAVVWLDGTVLDDTRQGDIGSVSLKFNA